MNNIVCLVISNVETTVRWGKFIFEKWWYGYWISLVPTWWCSCFLYFSNDKRWQLLLFLAKIRLQHIQSFAVTFLHFLHCQIKSYVFLLSLGEIAIRPSWWKCCIKLLFNYHFTKKACNGSFCKISFKSLKHIIWYSTNM